MKTNRIPYLVTALAAMAALALLPLRAEEQPAPLPPAETAPVPPAAAPAEKTPEPPPPAQVQTPPAAPTVALEATPPPTVVTPAPAQPAEEPAVAPAPAKQAAAQPERRWVNSEGTPSIFSDATIDEDERTQEAVVIWGDLTMNGEVEGDAVVIGGNAKINGKVGGALVCVLGTVELGPKAEVGGECVVVGGALANPHRVPVHGETVVIGSHTKRLDASFAWLRDGFLKGRLLVPGLLWPWLVFSGFLAFYLLIALLFRNGVNACAQTIEERPGGTILTALLLVLLAPLITILFTVVTLGLGGILILFAKVFGKVAFLAFLGRALFRAFGAEKSRESAVLTVLIGGALIAGLYCVPVLGFLVFLFSGWIGFGMVVYTIILRRRDRKAKAAAARAAAMPAPAAPAPVARTAPLRMAAPAASTVSAPASAAAPTPASPEEVSAGFAGLVAATPPTLSAGLDGDAAPVEPPAMAAPTTASATPPAPAVAPVAGSTPAPAAAAVAADLISASTCPRADFWVRLGAVVVDGLLVMFFVLFLGRHAGPFGSFPLMAGLYCGAMWLWRGTTVGGVIFNLKIVRLDDRPLDAATAVVRTLVGYLSVAAVGLGFLWCLWDPEQQTWHDKVAGTVVVRTPKGVPLV